MNDVDDVLNPIVATSDDVGKWAVVVVGNEAHVLPVGEGHIPSVDCTCGPEPIDVNITTVRRGYTHNQAQ